MAKLSENASDRANDAADTTKKMMESIVISSVPVVITAVQRKANIGNFENIDVYVGLAIPQNDLDLTDKDALRQGLIDAVDFGMSIASMETVERYKKIKDSAKPDGKR